MGDVADAAEKGLGRFRPVFSPAMELELVTHIKCMNKKVNSGLTPNKNGNCAEKLFSLLININENHAFMQQNLCPT